MKYLVNKETKEHIVFHADVSVPHPQWGIVEADSEGWIPWNGGECPVPAGTECYVQFKDGVKKVGRCPEWWQWKHNMDDAEITCYRPILAEKEEHGEHFKAYGAHMKASEAYIVSENVFDRLRQATEAADSIPAILAEINALLPEGYCVAKRSTVNEAHIEGIGGITLTSQPAEDMSDWRNWREGDLVTVHGNKGHYSDESYKYGKTYTVVEVCAHGLEIRSESRDSLFFSDDEIDEGQLRYHSRPSKVAE